MKKNQERKIFDTYEQLVASIERAMPDEYPAGMAKCYADDLIKTGKVTVKSLPIKVKSRKLSDAYVDKTIAKVDAMFESTKEVVEYPKCMSNAGAGMYGVYNCVLSEYDKQQIKAYFDQQCKLAFVNGFWRG